MNKKIFLTTLFVAALTLTACASNALATGSSPMSGSSASALPTQTQLVIGTIKLEETDFAVTAEQAKELLPMWHVLQDLNDSDTAAQEEIDGLVNQIQETMTDDQTQAIADMNLGPQDMMTIMQENGGGMGGAASSSQTGSTSSGGGGGNFAGGPPDMPAGGFPSGGMPGMGPSSTTSTSSSSSDTSTTRPAMTGTPSALFDAVIELLQKKVE